MSTWDEYIFSSEVNVDFLDDLVDLDEDDIIEAIRDAIVLAAGGDVTDDEMENGLAAATIAAIWAGAPFSSGDVVEPFPFIRGLVGEVGDGMNEQALELLEGVEEDYDLEAFIEALS